MNFLNTLDLDTLVLAFATFLVLIFVIKWHLDDKNDLDVKSVLMKDGRLNLGKIGQLVALMVSTWIIVYQTRKGALTDWLFTGYMIAWSGANLASKYIDSRSPQQYGSTTYNSSTSTYRAQPARMNDLITDDEPPLTQTEIQTQTTVTKAPMDFRAHRRHS